jgi:acetyl esterase/lipase
MSTLHLVDPELLPMIEARRALVLTKKTLPTVRKEFVEMRRLMASQVPARDDVVVTEKYLPGPKGAPKVRVLIYQPKKPQGPMAGYLHIHGGGYVVGEPEIAMPRNQLYAGELNCTVVSVDYRLSPETAFPGPVEDCYAVLKWLHANADALGVDRDRIAIGGESAGGGLAAGLGLLTRDRGKIKLCHQQLIYPMIDDRSALAKHPTAGEFIWNRQANHFGWSAMLGHAPGKAKVSPYVAAARAKDLKGLPPTFISTGALDLFAEENMEYARRLMRAGVPVEMHVYPGAVHGFDGIPSSRLAKQHARDQFEALQRALAAKPVTAAKTGKRARSKG